MTHRSALAALAVAMFAAGPALAQNYSFDCVSNNNAGNCSSGESQLGMSFSSAGLGRVAFRFTNTGPLAMSITDVYWDWASSAQALTILGASITDSGAGVSFGFGASPSNLPSGNSIGFSANLGADSNSPTQPMGVNPGEWLQFDFFGSYSNLSAALTAGTLDVGIHVQGYADGGSESFVSTPPVTAVPEPSTYALMLAGLGAVGFLARRRRA